MAKLKWMFLLAFLASGLVLGGCSSENDIIDNIDNNDNNDNTDKKPDIDFSKLTWTKRTPYLLKLKQAAIRILAQEVVLTLVMVETLRVSFRMT
ncbi:hypothetical protein [Bacteroides clarus]|uniref:hypothetical protein n=1 Tax=Bacteroides clarus TaxID=626929 RepID=UPI003FEFA11E